MRSPRRTLLCAICVAVLVAPAARAGATATALPDAPAEARAMPVAGAVEPVIVADDGSRASARWMLVDGAGALDATAPLRAAIRSKGIPPRTIRLRPVALPAHRSRAPPSAG